jgi:protein-S-isoprenylcysteine O-methyltransferase Ste14
VEPDASAERVRRTPEITRGIFRWVLRVGLFVAIFAASLFLSAGQLDWGMGWVYVGVLVATQILTALILIPSSPELMVARGRSEGPRDLDRVLASVMALHGPVVTLIVAGLDRRFGWSPAMPLALHLVALAVAVLGALLTIWAMASNRFFYGTFRIEPDRGHTVASTGPYQALRHPGYAGAILFQLATPILLGSLWGLIPAALTAAAIIVRTALEDGALQDRLDGYRDYAARVRYRLMPGVW